MNEDNLITITVDTGEQRLDKTLTEELTQYSRTLHQKYIRAGCVSVNGEVVLKTGSVVYPGDEITVNFPPKRSTDLIPYDFPLDVVFENNDLIIINKPAGIVVHPSVGHPDKTLVNAVLAHDPEISGIGGEIRPGIIHRLDKDTSGLIVVAKNDIALSFIQDQFRNRTIQKKYLALVDGIPPTPTGRIETSIGRNPSDRKRMKVVPKSRGRKAITEYLTIERFRQHTLLEVKPITGRTHQIRVHLAFIEIPVTGDRIYGKRKPTLELERQFLHAFSLELVLPGEEEKTNFQVDLPPELDEILVSLREWR